MNVMLDKVFIFMVGKSEIEKIGCSQFMEMINRELRSSVAVRVFPLNETSY